MSVFDDRRLGWFTLRFDFINRHRQFCEQLFTACIPIDARPRFDADVIEYLGISPYFEAVPVGMPAPWYDAEFHDPDGFVGFKRRT